MVGKRQGVDLAVGGGGKRGRPRVGWPAVGVGMVEGRTT
jgi:hypothetical protein